MSILDTIRARLSPSYRRKSAGAPSFGMLGGGDDVDYSKPLSLESAMKISTVWACARVVAETVATLPIEVYKTNKQDERQPYRQGYLYEMLNKRPNDYQTRPDFMSNMVLNLDIKGNAYARKVFTGKRVSSLIHIPSDDMKKVAFMPNGGIKYTYKWNGKDVESTNEEIFHVRGFGGTPLGGLSVLSYAATSMNLGQQAEKSALSVFVNRFATNVVITFDKWLTPDNRKAIKEGIMSQYSQAQSAGSPYIAEGGQKVTPISITPADAQLLQSRVFSVDDICRFFGVMPWMIGVTDKMSLGNSLDQVITHFLKFTLASRLARIEAAAREQLLTDDEKRQGVGIDFNYEGLLKADSGARSIFYKDALAGGWMTINEVRRKENLPPIDGGDVAHLQAQYIPITSAEAPKPIGSGQ